MDPEFDMRAFAEQPNRVRRGRAGHHKAARASDAVLDRLHHSSVDRLVHAEIVTVHDQDPCVRGEPQQLARQLDHNASLPDGPGGPTPRDVGEAAGPGRSVARFLRGLLAANVLEKVAEECGRTRSCGSP